MVGALAGDAALGFGVCNRCLSGDRKLDARVGCEERNRCEVGDRGVLREHWAACGSDWSIAALCSHAQCAVMSAVAAAAGWEIAVRVLRLCEQRRNGRKTEGGKQQYGEEAAHRCIQCNRFARKDCQ